MSWDGFGGNNWHAKKPRRIERGAASVPLRREWVSEGQVGWMPDVSVERSTPPVLVLGGIPGCAPIAPMT